MKLRVCVLPMVMFGDDKRPKNYSSEQYFKTGEQMSELFSDIPVPLKILSILPNVVMLPYNSDLFLYLISPSQMAIPSTLFRTFISYRFRERLNHLYPIVERDEDWAEIRKPYDDRIKYEVDIILKWVFQVTSDRHGLYSMGQK